MEHLQLRITLKMHFLEAHAADFLVKYAGGASFAAFTEQAMESKHQRFKPFRERFNVPARFQRINPVANESFRRAVVADAGSQMPASLFLSAEACLGR